MSKTTPQTVALEVSICLTLQFVRDDNENYTAELQIRERSFKS